MLRNLFSCLLLALLAIPVSSFAQDGVIRGRVTDASTGETLPGANVLVQQLAIGASVDINGEYTIRGVRPGTYTVVASFIGFREMRQTVNVTAGGTVSANFSLEADLRGLDDVVVTGIASRTARAISPVAVSRINAAQLNETHNYQSVAQLITGKTPGVQVFQSSGNVGGGVRFVMRSGAGLYGTGQPLIIVDGVRVQNVEVGGFGVGGQGFSSLSNLNPDDIENIEIIKGAAGGALYGTSGSNGVVLITTKRGRRTAGSFNATYRFQTGYNEKSNDYDPDVYISAADANAVHVRGDITQHSFNVQGSSDRVRYFSGVDIRDEAGIMANNSQNRQSFRANIEAFPSQQVTLRVSSSLSRIENNRPQNDNNIYGWLGNTLLQPTSYLYTDSLGVAGIDNRIRSNEITTSAEIGYTPFSFIEVRGAVGYQGTSLRNDATFKPGFRYAFGSAGQRQIWQYTTNRFNFDLNARGTYNLMPDLTATTIGGVTSFLVDTRTFDVTRRNFASDLVSNVGAGSEFIGADESFSNYREAGLFVQQEFNFRNAIYSTIGLRYDFSSSYGEEAGDIFYPRADLSVRLDQFGLAPGFMSLAKFRVAYGQSGQLPGAFDAIPLLWTATPTGYGGAGAIVTRVGNPLIKPERVEEFEVGMDFELFRNYGAEFTYFRQSADGSIVGFARAPSSGLTANAVPENVGNVAGWGFEAQFTATPLRTRNNQLDLTLNLSYADNEVKDIGGAQPIFDGFSRNVIKEGLRRGSFYLPVVHPTEPARFNATTGVYLGPAFLQEDGSAGAGTAYRTEIGSPIPIYTGSFSTNFRFARAFTLNVLADWGLGHYFYDGTLAFGSSGVAPGAANVNNRRVMELRRNLGLPLGGAVPANLYADIPCYRPSATAGTAGCEVNADAYRAAAEELARKDGRFPANYVVPADFLKLREVGLSFDASSFLRQAFTQSYIRSLQVSVSARNIATWTKYSGIDPEINGTGSRSLGFGQDFLTLQTPRSVNLSLSFGF